VGSEKALHPEKNGGNMFLTSGNETATPFGVLKPWYVYSIPTDYIKGLTEENKRCMEITDSPKLYAKKYFYGCMQDGYTLCIKRLGGAGDVIWTLPVAREMKRLYPKCKILYWVADMHNELLQNIPFIDGVLNSPTLDDLDNVDHILDYYESVERCNPAEYEEAFDLHWRWAFNTEFKGQAVGNITLKDSEILNAKTIWGDDYIVCSMSSSNPKRTYFQLTSVIDRLAKAHKVIVTGMGPFRVPEGKNILNLVNCLNLRELLAVIKNAKLLVSTDSGNVHFAAQLGVPTVGLYSTAHMSTRVKYYPKSYGIQSDAWCAPCVKLGEYCPNEPECLSRISVESVLSKVEEALKCNIPLQTT
jgi:ADP-heptose:LPS heptosyltransferase